jgi:RNA polymerase-interacting CarD/CdnL/TRCF family regulator
MKLTVGNAVACPPHGIGHITAREKRLVLDSEQEVLVIQLHNEMSIVLPLERARHVLRPPASEAELLDVAETLRATDEVSDHPWPKRLHATKEKLRQGSPLALAEVIRDVVGREREQAQRAGGRPTKVSPDERGLYLKARGWLSSEIALVRGISEEDADSWIEQQLASTSS